ncbi:hypothetical protein HN592_04110 [Candidatus Woesearchaeota archaeon]|jgi:ABC-2 type transport system permease protein|nr:hypothetical protein [Candidatus Woesearchaeota archaeon]MBT4368396.1 hypothetical protein [Candidatus Woesearchaeota archaeon]MBT4712885.1 hypothetical protein [Candidatus Woesearchaeota archaeon]MBT6639797.1 hypothetical protein [Candidatus Woesearchaeota archaeon]MBT7133969.1 hypothetical protein [Candidatus Woesearchaeota archaeon]
MISLFKIIKRAMIMRISEDFAYKLNFFIKFFAVMLRDFIGPLVILLIYTTTAGIPGWSFYEFILFQGTLTLVFGFGYLFAVMIPVEVMHNVRTGTFDKFLLKPLNTLVYLTASSFEWAGLAQILVGIALIVFAFIKLNLTVLSSNFVLYLILIFFGFLFQYAVMILIAALTFLWVQSWALLDLFFKLTDFARYPSGIYGSSLQFFLTFLFPVAISAFFPVEVLLRGFNTILLLKIIVPVLAFFIVSLLLWNLAMRKYTSAGG